MKDLEFTKLTTRVPMDFGDFNLKFSRFDANDNEHIITVVQYSKVLFRGVVQKYNERVEKGEVLRTINIYKGWASPLFTTKLEAISSSVKFLKSGLWK